MISWRFDTEEMGERRGGLADQHGETVYGFEAGLARLAQELGFHRIGDDIVSDRTRRSVGPVKGEGGLPAHAERGGVDDEIAASLPVIEGEIGGVDKMV